MSSFRIDYGHPWFKGDPGLLVVTRDSLTFKTAAPIALNYIRLKDTDVLAIKEKRVLFRKAAMVEYIASSQVKPVVFCPSDASVRELLLAISCIGFKPKAQFAGAGDPIRKPNHGEGK